MTKDDFLEKWCNDLNGGDTRHVRNDLERVIAAVRLAAIELAYRAGRGEVLLELAVLLAEQHDIPHWLRVGLAQLYEVPEVPGSTSPKPEDP